MNKTITQAIKLTLTAGALTAALAGCCMFGSDKGCCKKNCAPCCCAARERCKAECDGVKTHGANASMTLGVGTDGVRVGGDSNVGNHGASMHANAGEGGATAGAGGGVR